MGLTKLGLYIEPSELRNSDWTYKESSVVGISTAKQIIPTKADLNGVSLTSYKLFPPRHFANENYRHRLGNVAPILIKGSLEEASA